MKYPWKGLVRGILAVTVAGVAMASANASAQQGWEAKRLMRMTSEARSAGTPRTADFSEIAGIAKITEPAKPLKLKDTDETEDVAVAAPPVKGRSGGDEMAAPIEIRVFEMTAEVPDDGTDDADEAVTVVVRRPTTADAPAAPPTRVAPTRAIPTLATSDTPPPAVEVNRVEPMAKPTTEPEMHSRSTFRFPRPSFRLLPDVAIQPISLPKLEFRPISLPGVGARASAECEETGTHTVAKPAGNAFRIAVPEGIARPAKSISFSRSKDVRVATTATDEMSEEPVTCDDAEGDDCGCGEHGAGCGLFGCVQDCRASGSGLGFFGDLFRVRPVCVPAPNLPCPLTACDGDF